MIANNGKVPFLDLVSLHQELEAELVPVFQKVLRTAGFVGGPMVEEFEREFAHFTERLTAWDSPAALTPFDLLSWQPAYNRAISF